VVVGVPPQPGSSNVFLTRLSFTSLYPQFILSLPTANPLLHLYLCHLQLGLPNLSLEHLVYVPKVQVLPICLLYR
jgi:hypothetical protein